MIKGQFTALALLLCIGVVLLAGCAAKDAGSSDSLTDYRKEAAGGALTPAQQAAMMAAMRQHMAQQASNAATETRPATPKTAPAAGAAP